MPPEIKRKISILQGYLEKLIPYTEISSEELSSNEEKQAAMERWFLLMVDEAIDINSALMYHLGNKVAELARSTFSELVPLGILDKEFAGKIAESVKIRNELTHNYEKRQKSVVIDDMKKFIKIYKEYTQILIEKFIKT